MRLAGWDIVESYSAASVDGDVEDRCGCFAPLLAEGEPTGRVQTSAELVPIPDAPGCVRDFDSSTFRQISSRGSGLK